MLGPAAEPEKDKARSDDRILELVEDSLYSRYFQREEKKRQKEPEFPKIDFMLADVNL